LPSGEVIPDLNGEWDMQDKGYGLFGMLGTVTDRVIITQDGTSFRGVKQIGTEWIPKGTEIFKGELDKDGFREFFQYIHVKEIYKREFVWEKCKAEITEAGNKLLYDFGGRIKGTLTRK
ncbi:MAG: hypothetical protein P8017_09670, partial [Deltaproteobacteria bacterium]